MSALSTTVLSQDQVALIKRTIAKDATDDELQMFVHQCNKTGLDPLSKQIYFQKYTDRKTGQPKVTIITGIDGYRAVADRSGVYAGSDEAVFDDESKPNRATVTVYKMVQGVRCGFSATARWNEYYPGDAKGFMWNKMPCTMLAKCAEALALRKAFPNQLSGVYTKEEMEQAEKAPVTSEKYDPLNPDHKRILARLAASENVTEKNALIELSTEMKGVDLDDLQEEIKKYIGPAVKTQEMHA